MIQKALEQRLEHELGRANLSETLAAACRYAVFPGGKRVRPLLLLNLHQLVSGPKFTNDDSVLGWAAALEFLHCASLVHDDLPGLDNDDVRRGMPSCHKKFSVGTAVLAGDALVSLALASVAKGKHPHNQLATALLADAYTALCDGQQRDIAGADTRDDLYTLYRLKTGALFGAAVALGCLSAQSDAKVLAGAVRVGELLGILFQLKDDQIDSKPEEKGRGESSDKKNQRQTLYDLAPETINSTAELLSKSIANLAQGIGTNTEKLAELLRY